ncbi:MAG TPA: alpha/beta hydrolase [Xanthobacteraceae bacterium]|nr:alpha/beta hydrolase [Xanthobacteraceae bacterium]
MTDSLLTIDRFVPHISTVPANKGQTVGLFLREKISARTHADLGRTSPPVVLFVHGGFAPAVVAFDLAYKDGRFSYMAALARKGFDVFAITHTGYGSSPKPMMDDPCNIDAAFQHLVIPHVLNRPMPPRYPFKLVSSRTEWDEIETVVRFIRELRGVERISFVAWSTGVPRAGGFAALYPDEVDKLVFFGPAPYQPNDAPPVPMPEPGAPTILQTREFLLQNRWGADVRCDGQLDDPGVQDAVWRALMEQDGLGASWGADGRGIMRAPNRMNFGWRQNVGKIRAPTLFMLGEFDNYERRLDAWHGLRVEHKAFVKIRCASHFVQFEQGRHLLHRLTAEWLSHGTVDGKTRGEFVSDGQEALQPLGTEAIPG